jgi:hypothetical protein
MERLIKGTQRSGKVPNPDTFEVTKEAIVPKSIVLLDETKCLFNTTQYGPGLATKYYPNPKAINSPAGRKVKFQLVDKSETLALPHVIEPYETGVD